MPTPVPAYGLYLQLGNANLAGSPVYSTIAQVKLYGNLERESVMAVVTHFQSPGGYEEVFPSGIKRLAPLTITISYDPADGTHDITTGLHYVFNNNLLRAYNLIYPDSGTFTVNFEAYIEKLSDVFELENELAREVTFRFDGQPTES